MTTCNSNYFSTSHKTDLAKERWNQIEKSQQYRNEFAKDRDRILYSKSFLRMRDKTQVFMMENIDYIRTRLTHTLEVSQIARTISSALGFNVDLTEAIALGHDVGHTPFGHVGERTLDLFTSGELSFMKKENSKNPVKDKNKGFKHNLQSARVLCDLEPGTDGNGLNLTKFTLWGIIHHSKIKSSDKDYPFYKHYVEKLENYWSFEGYVVAIADEIAQRHHDIEDSLRYNILSTQELIRSLDGFTLYGINKKNYNSLTKAKEGDLSQFISLFSRFIVNMYVTDLISNSKENLRQICKKYSISCSNDFYRERDSINTTDRETAISLSNDLSDFDKNFKSCLYIFSLS